MARTVMSDRITLRGLVVRGHHGVFEHERTDGQDFVIDVELAVDTLTAARSDDLADTVDYGAVAATVAAVVGGEPVNLLETLAERIATACLADVRVSSVDVTVHKPNAPIPLTFGDVAVTITRVRQ
jgi:dihydroneopterin aldolase